MKPGIIIGAIVVAVLIGIGVYMIDINQTQEAQMPDVSISGGQAPEFEAEVGTVTTGTEEVTVEVPTVEVTPPGDDTVVTD